MTYVPPRGDSIDLSLADDYLPRYGGNIILGGTGYIPRWGGDLYHQIVSGYVVPLGDAIPLVFGIASYLPQEPDTPTIEDGLPKMRPGVTIAYNDAKNEAAQYTLRFKDAGQLVVQKEIRWVKKQQSTDVEIIVPWGELSECEKRWRLKYARFTNLLDYTFDSPFTAAPPEKDAGSTLPWGMPDPNDSDKLVDWSNPPAKDTEKEIPWAEAAQKINTSKRILSKTGKANDGHHTTKWGKRFFEEICTRDYKVPGGGNIDFNLDMKNKDVDDGLLIRFHFDALTYDLRCKHDEPTGWRDAYVFRPPVKFPYPRTPIKELWIIMNSVSLTRVSDNKPLAATDITVSSDLGSWCWGFDATINNLDSYLAICPDGTNNTIVRATMNGRNWLARIERASETVAFGKPAWRVSGRSLSAELAAPSAAATSYLESADRTAVQLMEAALENSGWTLVMESVDWLVAGGSLSVENETPLQVVQRIATAAGAVVQTDSETKTLRIIPRYKGNPWTWSTDTPDLSIDESVVRSFSPEWVPGVQYNGVYVSGRNQGVLARVIRSGSAGDQLAPMVTDQLCTATEVAMERGRNILAGSGAWQNISIDLPMMPGVDLPGLLVPGSLIEVTQGTRGTWRAQVVSTKIKGIWNKGCSVRQQLSVERYFGN
ncbi:MAG: hypothetical protein COA36_11785 [Desulfotalea sp.]|nr:MAG: hypothetical protein COA36_11785 [Desulfotalea sp.]